MADKIFRPHRGTKTFMEDNGTVLADGEIFFEVPALGIAQGNCNIKMGDGTTAYADLPYAINIPETAITFDTSTTEDNDALLDEITSGKTISAIIGSAKKLLSNLSNGLDSLSSGKADVNHASDALTYGGATDTLYGHVMLTDNYSTLTGDASTSIAASNKAVYDAYNELYAELGDKADELNTLISALESRADSLDTSVSSIEGDITDLNNSLSEISPYLVDSGWQSLPLSDGVSEGSYGGTPSYRKIGNLVFVRGGFAFEVNGLNMSLGNLPSGFRPLDIVYTFLVCTGAYIGRVETNPYGNIILAWLRDMTNNGAQANTNIGWSYLNFWFFTN